MQEIDDQHCNLFWLQCSDKYSRRMTEKGHRLHSITPHQVAEDSFTAPKLKVMWNALKYSEAIKYAGKGEGGNV